MSFLHVLLIAVGLAADAFAVSVAEGIALHRLTHGHTLRVAAHFGAFQGAMPVVGWLAGRSLARFIGAFDHWVAFGLLAFLGVKMVLDSLTGFETGEGGLRRPSRGARLIALSLATSIDALAVGLSLALLGVEILEPALVIGGVTAVLCAVGIQMGDRIGTHLGHWAEACGGAILCLVGLSILVEHLW